MFDFLKSISFPTWMTVLEKVGIPLLEVSAGIVIGPMVKRLILKLSEKSLDKGAMTFIGSAANVLIIIIACILAVEQLGVRMTSVIALVSALGLGISLALKDNMANVAGGLQILITKPFVVGDYISISGHKGLVTAIELMFTTIKTDNDKEVIIPNSTVVTDMITNYSKTPNIRIIVPFCIGLPNDLDAIEEQAIQTAKNNPMVNQDKVIETAIDSWDENYVTLKLICYSNWQDYEKCKHALSRELLDQISIYKPPKDDTHLPA